MPEASNETPASNPNPSAMPSIPEGSSVQGPSPSPQPQATPSLQRSSRRQVGNWDLLEDCRVMMRYALREGVDITPDLRHDLSVLIQNLVRLGIAPLCEIPEALQLPPSKDPSRTSGGTNTGQPIENQPTDVLELLLKVYAGLSKAVAPATAETLTVTERKGPAWWPFRGLPFIVQFAAMISICSAIVFSVASLSGTRSDDGKQRGVTNAETNKPSIKPPLPTIETNK